MFIALEYFIIFNLCKTLTYVKRLSLTFYYAYLYNSLASFLAFFHRFVLRDVRGCQFSKT